MAYYDGTKLLSLQDMNGNTPEIYICTSNRTGGKTTYFNRWCVNRFLKYGEKFMIEYRWQYELSECSDNFFKDIGSLFFNGMTMTHEIKGNGSYAEFYLNKQSCGYAVALNNAEGIKKQSHLFSDTARILFDEFQSETSKYCPNEVKKFQSIHTSIARGQGKQVRYVPVIMISNPVSLINPYYTAMGISSRLKKDTKFLKGDGWVLEQGFVKSASEAQLSSGFNKAFAGSEYVAYSAQNVYLNDSQTFVENVSGRCSYLCTLRYNGKDFGVKLFPEQGIAFVDNKPDLSYPLKIAVTTPDHAVNYVMLKMNSFLVSQMRTYFEKGCFRFKDLLCKECLMTAVSYI